MKPKNRNDIKQTTGGGRCCNCRKIFIGEPLYRHSASDFACKDCILILQKEDAKRRIEEGDDYEDVSSGGILEVNEEDL